MSIKLLPESVNLSPSPVPDLSTSLVPLTQRALASRAGQIRLVPPADIFARSSSPRRGNTNRIYGTFVEDSQGGGTGRSGGRTASAWSWSRPVGSTAAAHYLFYAAAPAAWRGRLIDLYA